MLSFVLHFSANATNLFKLHYVKIETTLIDGDTVVEKNGELKFDVIGHFLWFHTKELYNCYDTYAKMRRYKKEWREKF